LTSQELQEEVLSKLKVKRKETLLSAALGEDCCAIRTDKITLYSSDPITACEDIHELGALVVNVCCNDIAACGGTPIAILLTLILPSKATKEDVGIIMDGAQKRSEELGIDILGGHTEFSDSVIRPIACGTAIGTTDKLLTKKDLKVNQSLLVTKSLGMEGATLLAYKYSDLLSVSEREAVRVMAESLSVQKESDTLSSLDYVSCMHDVTEGGILGAVAEICESVGLGAEIYEAAMPIDPVTEKLCRKANVNPLRLLSSGSMLVSTSNPDSCIKKLSEVGIKATEIGLVTSGAVRLIKKDGSTEEIKILPDEICGKGDIE